jgi:hypothetical protein
VSGPNGSATGSFEADQSGRAVEAELIPGQTYTVTLSGSALEPGAPAPTPYYSRTITVTVAAEPPMPLTAVAASDSTINLSWVPHTWKADGFKVERSTDPAAGTWQTLATVPASRHRLQRLRRAGRRRHVPLPGPADDPGGADGTNSAVASAVAALPAPTDLGVTQDESDLSLVFAWSYPEGTDARFTVERSVDGGPFETLGTTEPNVTATARPARCRPAATRSGWWPCGPRASRARARR